MTPVEEMRALREEIAALREQVAGLSAGGLAQFVVTSTPAPQPGPWPSPWLPGTAPIYNNVY